jgi:DNA invertase Pin-like site-specific DNA recombinase
MKTPRVAIYARVSTSDQRPDLQIHELRVLATQRGWTIMGEYVDQAASGSKDRRPELDRLMVDVTRGKIDIVVVWKFDRFARSLKHLITALDDFRARGIDFLSACDAVDTSTPTGRFTFSVIAAVAELERDVIRERTRAGIAAARRRGVRVGRPRVEVDVDAARRLLATGGSVRSVARTLRVGASTLARAPKTEEPLAAE